MQILHRCLILIYAGVLVSCANAHKSGPSADDNIVSAFNGAWNLEIESIYPKGELALSSGCGIYKPTTFMIVSQGTGIVRFGRGRGEGKIASNGGFSIKVATDTVYPADARHNFVFTGNLKDQPGSGRLKPGEGSSSELCDAWVRITRKR